MDHRSELGPIDPQVEYMSSEGRKREAAEDIIDGFEQAKEILAEEGPSATPAYVPLGQIQAPEKVEKTNV